MKGQHRDNFLQAAASDQNISKLTLKLLILMTTYWFLVD